MIKNILKLANAIRKLNNNLERNEMISVCMAVYNGERYIGKQLASILNQLDIDDEIILVNDFSTDSSLEIINQFLDSRIKVFSNSSNLGVIKSFERSILIARGEYIFLSDQDDIWMKDKVKTIVEFFKKSDSLAVVSDATVIDINEKVISESFFKFKNSGPGLIRNLFRNGFLGCCLSFRSEAVSFITPFPKGIQMHDEWIGLTCSLAGTVSFLDKPLIQYRRHDGNLTEMKPGSLIFMVRKRLTYILCLIHRFGKIRQYRFTRQMSGNNIS